MISPTSPCMRRRRTGRRRQEHSTWRSHGSMARGTLDRRAISAAAGSPLQSMRCMLQRTGWQPSQSMTCPYPSHWSIHSQCLPNTTMPQALLEYPLIAARCSLKPVRLSLSLHARAPANKPQSCPASRVCLNSASQSSVQCRHPQSGMICSLPQSTARRIGCRAQTASWEPRMASLRCPS